jgi:hypothetical protein
MAKKKKQERGSTSSIEGVGTNNVYSNKTQVVSTEPTKTTLTSIVSTSKPAPAKPYSIDVKESVGLSSTPKPTPVAVSLPTNVSSFGATTKTNIISTSTDFPTSQKSSSALSSSERINPFDKNSSNYKTPIETPPVVNATYSSFEKPEAKSGTNLDDLTKSRFEKQQGIQDRNTGRYDPVASQVKPTIDPPSDKYSSYTSSYMPEKVDVKPTPSESKFSRTNSSDADIIFGSKTNMEKYKEKYTSRGSLKQSFDRSSTFNSNNSMSSDSDYIYGGKRDDNNTFEKSLSLSSDKDGDFASDSRVRGIQNAAFQDYDSPVQSKSIANKWTADDDYDLK